MRRHGRENNFKAVLETIRGLIEGAGSIGRVLPPWLQSILLGQGDPLSASYDSSVVQDYARHTVGVNSPTSFLDFGDTFVDEKHLKGSFKGEVTVTRPVGVEEIGIENKAVRLNYKVRVEEVSVDGPLSLEASPYSFQSKVPGNSIRFTPLQVEAIRSGLSPGLTLVVGPPGTG